MRADRNGFLDLFDRHAEAIHAYFTRRVGRADADDLLAEAWIRAYSSRNSFRGSWPHGLPWLYGVARNTLRVHWQRVGRRLDTSRPAEIDPWFDVDTRLDARNATPALREALLLLSEDDREVLLLVAWEQLTPTETAAVLGIPPGTARSRLHRARAQMRRGLDEAPHAPSEPHLASRVSGPVSRKSEKRTPS